MTHKRKVLGIAYNKNDGLFDLVVLLSDCHSSPGFLVIQLRNENNSRSCQRTDFRTCFDHRLLKLTELPSGTGIFFFEQTHDSLFDKFKNLSSGDFGNLNDRQLHDDKALSNYFGHNENWVHRNVGLW